MNSPEAKPGVVLVEQQNRDVPISLYGKYGIIPLIGDAARTPNRQHEEPEHTPTWPQSSAVRCKFHVIISNRARS